MSEDRTTVAPRTRVARSRVTNGRLQVFGDGRSAGARRFRDLIEEFTACLPGGFETLRECDRQAVRAAASACAQLELLDAQRAAGESVDPAVFATLVNAQRRSLRDVRELQERLAPVKPGPTLAEHLASKYGQPQEAA